NMEQVVEQASHNPNTVIDDQDRAYIIYTSGSTGTPKGVEITHAAIKDRIIWKSQKYPMSKHDAVLHTYSLIFDGSILEYLWPLCFGIKLVIASSEEILNTRSLTHLIQTHHITTFDMLPSLLHVLLEDENISRCTSLKYVFTGGEPLSREVIQLFFSKMNAQLYNTYGPTEATVQASEWACRPIQEHIAPIGKPIAGAKLYIVDKHLNLLPVGIPGELCIGGTGIARGYINNAQQTSEKFVRDLFSQEVNATLYRTGDRVKYQSDGNILFLGRSDYQVKIRGFRIELGEIESQLLNIDEVKEAVVCAHKNTLFSYVIPKNIIHDENVFILFVRNKLKKTIPSYMMPEQIILLNKLPYLSNGKVNRSNLRPPSKRILKTDKILTKTETILLIIWRDVLNEELTIYDNFFELGGHSLLAISLMTRIRAQFNIDLPISILFDHPNIELLAPVIELNDPSHWTPLVNIQPNGNKRPFFFVHPIGGNVLCYSELSKNLKIHDQPLYGLQAYGLTLGQKPYESMSMMVQQYIDALLKIKPQGPFVLGGWSYGGLVALAMAHQLEKMNYLVKQVIMIDSILQADTVDGDDDKFLIEALSQNFGASFKDKEKLTSTDIAHFFDPDDQNAYSAKYLDQVLTLVKSHYKALRTHSFSKILAPILLIRAKETQFHIPNAGLHAYSDHIEEIIIEGNHWSILQKTNIQSIDLICRVITQDCA
ncbi:MAG: amino acid adenylation domain-containing protein, partial [Legionella longbeachae]|nr:amino acid adenylation domain-containing protein [Legionella longbeachae]